MADFKDRMADYVPVNERLAALLDKHPEGSLQSEIVELTDTRVTIKAYAYRTADDARPGIGHSSLNIPGSTPYTKGSEIENAETSAWGRAIAALGFEVKRGLASAEEVRNKQPERTSGGQRAAGASPSSQGGRASSSASAPVQTDGALRDAVAAAAAEHHVGTARLSLIADAVGVPKGQRASADQLRAILAYIEQPSSVPTPADGGVESAQGSAPPTTPQSEGSPDSSGSDVATAQGSGVEAAPSGTPPDPASAPTIEDVLAVTGGTVVPPPLDSDEFKALPPAERATARVYWQTHPAEAVA